MIVFKRNLLFQGQFSGSMLNFGGVIFQKTSDLSVFQSFPTKKIRPLAHGLWQGKSFALLYVSYGHAHGDSFYYEDS